jgi:ribosomal protein S12 methylthiotransferase
MKTKSIKKNKVNVITLGCSKNLFDSEVLMAQLKANKFTVEHESESLDNNIVIVNTCGFIDNAKQESIDTIIACSEAKAEGKIQQLIVTGCLSHRYKDELKTEFPEVDNFFGTNELPKLLKTLKADYKHELIGERILTTPAHYAYFKIAEGCDRPCSFCAIPLMRGKHVSTPIEQLVENAKKLAAQGVKELILIAQDLTYYGLDLYGKRKLAYLLEKLCEIDGIEWIRLHYAYPSGFPLDVLDVMAKNEKVCNYIDIPLQHASDKMLKAMRRGITKEKTYELISTFRERVPDIAIRTTLITGFPNESISDFEELKKWVEEIKFDRLGVFPYSHEENTYAFTMEDSVPEKEKIRRANEIMDIQQNISFELNQQKIGKKFKVLIDRKEGDYFVGRTQFDSPEVDNEVLVNAQNNYLRIGDFCKVEIIDAEAYDLIGKAVE